VTLYTANGVNDTDGLRAAMLAAAGGVLEIEGHPRLVHDGAPELLLWERPLHIKMRAPLGVLYIDPAVPNDVPIMHIRPLAGQSSANWAIEGAGIFPVSGNPGGHGFVFEKGGSGIGHFNMRRCMVNGIGGYAIHCQGATGNNPFFNSVVEGGAFSGQMGSLHLDGCGDSLVFRDAWLHGPGYGIYAENIPGAAQCTFTNMSIVNAGGAAYLKNCNQLKIRDTQSEQDHEYTGDQDAMYVLDGCIGCEITGTNMNNHGRVRNIVFRNGSSFNRIAGCTIRSQSQPPVKSHVHFEPTSGWGNKLDGDNLYLYEGGALPTPWLGTGQMTPQFGAWTAVPLASGWAAHSDTTFYTGIDCKLEGDRQVVLRGAVASGTNTAGTVIATLPVGARPSWKSVRSTVRCKNGGAWSDGQIEINAMGQIKIAQAFPATALVSFDGVRLATY
jgi:hypothetical protein